MLPKLPRRHLRRCDPRHPLTEQASTARAPLSIPPATPASGSDSGLRACGPRIPDASRRARGERRPPGSPRRAAAPTASPATPSPAAPGTGPPRRRAAGCRGAGGWTIRSACSSSRRPVARPPTKLAPSATLSRCSAGSAGRSRPAPQPLARVSSAHAISRRAQRPAPPAGVGQRLVSPRPSAPTPPPAPRCRPPPCQIHTGSERIRRAITGYGVPLSGGRIPPGARESAAPSRRSLPARRIAPACGRPGSRPRSLRRKARRGTRGRDRC